MGKSYGFLNLSFSDKRIKWILSFEKGLDFARNTHSWKSIYEFLPISQENLSAFTGRRALRGCTRGFLPLVNSLIGINDDSPLCFIIFKIGVNYRLNPVHAFIFSLAYLFTLHTVTSFHGREIYKE